MSDRHQVAGIVIVSGVSAFTGEGFCHVEIHDTDHRIVGVAQLSPKEVRAMALHWLSAADAAESDAGVLAVLTDAGISEQVRGGFLVKLRARRKSETT